MLANFVQEVANAPGAATTINLAGPPTGRRGFLAAFASGASVYYFLDDGTQSEWGIGTVTSGTPNTLSRTTVISNSAGTTARLNFTGSVRVYNEVPAERVVALMPDAAAARTTLELEGIWRRASSTTVSGSAVGSVVFTLPTWASEIRVEWSRCQPSGGAAPLIAQISQDGGATYLTGAGDYGGVIQDVRTAGASFGGMSGGALVLSPGIPTTQAIDGYIQMRRAASAASDIGAWGIDNTPARFRTIAHGGGGTATPTHIRFVFSGQSIAVGSTFTLFGRA